MRSPFRNAYKVFEEITQRNVFIRNSAYSLYYRSMFNTYAYYEDPVEFHGEKDNVISWTSKISSLVKQNQSELAVGLFKMMLMTEQRPNHVTVLSVIRAISGLGLEDMMRVICGSVIKLGFESEVSVATALIGFYSDYDMGIVWKIFNQTPIKDLVLWSAMVSACVKSGQYGEAFEIFRAMQYDGVEPNHVSIVSILPACANVGALLFGKEIHGFSIKKMFHPLTNVHNSLVDMYAKCRNFKASMLVFDQILEKDLISWTTIIRGCIENDCPREAFKAFSRMQFSCFGADETIVQDMIVAIIQADEHKFGIAFHGFLLKNGLLAFVSIGTALLQMYAKFGELESAIIVFDQLDKKDYISWSAMISVHAHSRHPYNALETFKQMQSTDERPNEITFVSLLQACSLIGAQELGESIQAHATKAGYLSNAFLSSALIDLYCKFGRINQGRAIFNEIPTKDLVCWSSMINGYGLNGCGDEALETFSNMLACGVKPNEVVFISVLSACSHCGLEHEGWSCFSSMEQKYGIIPKLPHYACMVDLISRRGNIEGALQFVNKMPMEPDKRIWGALLAGCRSTHGSIEIAELVAERLIGLDPQNTSYYVILSNLYAEQGRWGDVERLRKLVDEKGLKKEMGYSMIEAQ
ncbi:hypothetical protein AAG906_027385 [Vitis piasezkii]